MAVWFLKGIKGIVDQMFPYTVTEFLYVFVILSLSFAFIWLVCKVFKIRRSGIPHLGAILVAFALSPFHPLAVLVAAVPFSLGFIAGRSTKVAFDPTNVFSPKIKLSNEEYAYRAEQHSRIARSSAGWYFFSSPHVDPASKLSFLFQGFGLYRHARAIALTTSWLYIEIWSMANLSGSSELYFLLFMLSLPFGTAMGFLWKYIKGHPGSPKIRIGGLTFRPTIRSFIISSFYGATPAITAAVVTFLYYYYEKGLITIIILDILMGLFFLYLIGQTIIVHLQRISLLEDGIVISGVSSPYGIRWVDIEKAVVRERHNLLSGTDKLLVLYSKQGVKLAFPISILSKHDEDVVIREVRSRVPTSTRFDMPTV